MNRIKERKVAFEIIFLFPFNEDKTINQIIESYLNYDGETKISEYISNTVKGVADNLERIDNLIKDNIKNRKFERLDNVCLAVMRLAVYEMLFNEDIPVNVAINEALELIKQYDDGLASFVHGNLAIISKAQI